MYSMIFLIFSVVHLTSVSCDPEPLTKSLFYSTELESIIYGIYDSSQLTMNGNNLTLAMVNCTLIDSPKVISTLLTSAKKDQAKSLFESIDEETFNRLADLCPPLEGSKIDDLINEKPIAFGLPKSLLIAPGTKWCGPGSQAANFSDLGPNVETDKCCRDHDHCPIFIGPHSNAYGLTNSSPYTSSDCECDRKLAKCLKQASRKELGASLVGIVYFNIARFRCISKVKPVCLEYSPLPMYSDRCLRYVDSNETVYQYQEPEFF